MKEPKTYIAWVMCDNCHLKKRIKIPVRWLIIQKRCPKCGLKELHHPSYFFGTGWGLSQKEKVK